MKWLKAIFEELIGLFVDDGRFALAIVAWVAILGLVSRATSAGAWQGVVLFAGLAVILVESVLRRTRRR